jgi:spore germination protein YaaH
VKLLQRVTDPAGLGFYTFGDGRWRQVAAATLGDDGEASGEFPTIPKSLAVLRVVAQRYQVAASLPTGSALHPEAQPLLNIVSPRDYVPQGDGSLTGQATPLVLGGSTLVIPTIVGNDEAAATAVASILSDPVARQNHIDAIIRLVSEGEFAGIDLEYVLAEPDLRQDLTRFVEALAQALHEQGQRLSLTLPAAIGDEEAAAYDWKALGAQADMIKVLPHQDPAAYWETMSQALRFATRNVAPEKLFLAVSPFTIMQEMTRVSPIGYQQAMFLATQMEVRSPSDPLLIVPAAGVDISAINIDQGRGASGLQWSDDARAIVFAFGPQGNRSTVFLENVFSTAFKLELVQIFGLAGVAVAQTSDQVDVANIWPAVKALVDTGTAVLTRPELNVLAPQWFAPGGGDIIPQDGAIVWHPPTDGQHTIVLVVSDGVLRFSRRLAVEVQPAIEPTPLPLPPATEIPPELEVPTPTATPTPEAMETPAPEATETPVPDGTETPVPEGSETPVPEGTETPVPELTPAPTP